MEPSRYEVVGPREFLGHGPGSVFEACLPAEQEERALAAGHIAPSKSKPRETEARLTPALAAALADQERASAAAAATSPIDEEKGQ